MALIASPGSIVSRLRIVPTGHHQPLPARSSPALTDSIYSCLDRNPYIPFFHIWKPATPWSKSKWDKGSDEGLIRQKPDFFAAIVEYVQPCDNFLILLVLHEHDYGQDRGER